MYYIHFYPYPLFSDSLGKLMSEKIETCNYLARLTGTFNQSVSKSVFEAILLLMKFVSEVGKSSLLRPYNVQDGYTHYTIHYTDLEYWIMVWKAIYFLYFILKLIFLKVIYKSWKSSTSSLQFRKFDFELSFFSRGIEGTDPDLSHPFFVGNRGISNMSFICISRTNCE